MTLGKKLYMLAGINIVLTIVVGVIGYRGINQLDPATSPLVREMTALRNAMTVDMMHDAFRSDVLRSLLINISGDTQFGDKAAVEHDLKVHLETMQRAFKENQTLELNDTIRTAISEVSNPLSAYQKGAKQASELAFADPKKAASQYGAFQELFSQLEDALERSSGMIRQAAEDTQKANIESAQFMRTMLICTSILAFIIGMAVSTWLVINVVGTLRTHLIELSSRSNEVRSQAEVMTKASVDLSSSATEQAASVQESVAAVAQLLSMISHSSDFARQTITAAKLMTEKTQDGNQVMSRLSSSMNSIQQANAQLINMAGIIQEISNKTAVINDIVFKTQLLSFNASIEAARAGQHGRGFAVVAEEVGNLAEMSGSSAREIQSLLEDSRKQVASIIENVQWRVAEGEDVSREAVKIFNQISSESNNIENYIQRINDSSREQESGVQQISVAISQVGAAASKNNISAADTSRSSKLLFEQSNGLRHIICGLQAMALGTKTNLSAEYLRVATDESEFNEMMNLSQLDNKCAQTNIALNGTYTKGIMADDDSFRPYSA